MYKKYQIAKWSAIILAVILAVACVFAIVTHISKIRGEQEDKIVATFDFGKVRSHELGHSDGSVASEDLTFEDGDYELVLTNLDGVYNKAYDEYGNSCLKLGTATKGGTFTFEVSEDITTVIVYVAGYKSNTAKLTVNDGKVQTIKTLSDDGQYTAIEIEVPEDGTITIATAEGGYRAMIDRIVFIAD